MKITINGKQVEAREGQTVLQAALAAGIYIPHLCYHEKVGVAGKCRACVVEIEGMRGLQTSCSVLAKEDMNVTTNSPTVLNAQRLVVDLMLSSGTHDCLACEQNGNCELQDAAYYLGIERPSVQYGEINREFDISSEFIYVERNKCISCGRCVAACNNVVVNEVLDFGHRGHHTEIVFDADKKMGESTCVQCGECVQICPVGAIVEKKNKGRSRYWETQKVRTTCPYCGVGCQLELHVKDDQIVKVTGVEDAEPNKGRLCVKGRFGYDFIYSKDRLTTPLIKEKGQFREASWDEALGLIASKFKAIIEKDGPDAVAGVSCARSINEDSYSMQKLFRSVFKTNNIDHCART
jgi:predicted molibdopterin-dependent oxidoreductase YjgC